MPLQYYTYEDWFALGEGVRAEIINGELYMMQLPPLIHQSVSGELLCQLGNFLKGNSDVTVLPRIAVRLNPTGDTALEPDIVVCGRSMLNEYACIGAPDLIIEIIDHHTARRDRLTKFNLYQSVGVREYWLIDPETKTLQACILQNGVYVTHMYDTTAPVTTLPGCEINLTDVFAE